MLKFLLYIILFSFLTINSLGQDTLPNFQARIRSGKVIIGWVNPFKDVVLMNIQRSPDSLRNFKTILTVADPTAITNGYLDSKAPDTKQFYRLFVQQAGGRYFFTAAYKPFFDTSRPKPKTAASKQSPAKAAAPLVAKEQAKPEAVKSVPADDRQGSAAAPAATATEPVDSESIYKPQKNDNQKVTFSNTRTFGKDSAKIGSTTRDFSPPPVLVFSNSLGQVVIVLPEEKKNAYTLKFFSDAGDPIFTLNKIRESHLTIEKTNFHNAGWYRCELYEQEKLRQKYRFFISKE